MQLRLVLEAGKFKFKGFLSTLLEASYALMTRFQQTISFLRSQPQCCTVQRLQENICGLNGVEHLLKECHHMWLYFPHSRFEPMLQKQ